MRIKIYLTRDICGNCTWCSHRADLKPESLGHQDTKSRTISTTKQLAYAVLQSGTRKVLFDTAWRMALACDSVSPSHTFKHGESFDVQTIEYARQEAFQVDHFIGQLVNNPNSKFYLHG